MWLIWSIVLFEFFGYICANKHESIGDQLCIDPRTSKKHEAYSEWSDAYSCARHRCQPSGKTMAMFTVGCKKVEAPDTAIECEQVVEDTNMQFPYCCTRLRCLVVVRGEIWTKVLGQPWEALPAAPWSHMYKIKKPAPEPNMEPLKLHVINPKSSGPVYQLDSQDSLGENNKKKVLNQRVRRRRSTTYSPHAHTHDTKTADEVEFNRGEDYQLYKDVADGKDTTFQGSSEAKTQYKDDEYQTMSPEMYEKLQDLKSISDTERGVQDQGTQSAEIVSFDAAEKIAKEQKEAADGQQTADLNELVQNIGSGIKGLESSAQNAKSETGLDYKSTEENHGDFSTDTPLDQEIEKEDTKLVTEERRPLLEEREGNNDISKQERRKKHSRKFKRRRMQKEKIRRKKSNAEVDFHKSKKNI